MLSRYLNFFASKFLGLFRLKVAFFGRRKQFVWKITFSPNEKS